MMKQMKCSVCTNENCFIHLLESKEQTQYAEQSKSQSWYKKGQYIITEGAPVRGIFFILKGRVKVISTGMSTKMQTVRLARKGHILGHRGYGGETYPIGAIAMETTIVCFFNNRVLRELFMSNPEFTYGMMMFYSQELRHAERRIKYLSQMTVNEKIAESLLYFTKVFGHDSETGLIQVDLPRKEIADLAGTNPDQVSRALSLFQKENTIKIKGRKIYITKLDQLKDLIRNYEVP